MALIAYILLWVLKIVIVAALFPMLYRIAQAVERWYKDHDL